MNEFGMNTTPVQYTIILVSKFLDDLINDNNNNDDNDNEIVNTANEDTKNKALRRKDNAMGYFSAFASKSIPEIGLLDYLTRILKYCPFGNEVALGLAAHTIGLTMVSRAKLEKERKEDQQISSSLEKSSPLNLSDPSHLSVSNQHGETTSHRLKNVQSHSNLHSVNLDRKENVDRYFGMLNVNIYTIHRIIISLITTLSKLCSDVFYTNSRYAKVGGLPLSELNNLEIKILISVNFNLFVPEHKLQLLGTLLASRYKNDNYKSSLGSECTLDGLMDKYNNL